MVELLFRWVEDFKHAGLVRLAFGEPRAEQGRTVIPVGDVWVQRTAAVDGTGKGDVTRLPDPTEGAKSMSVALLTADERGVRLSPTRSQLVASVVAGVAAGLGASLGWWLVRGRDT